MSVPAMANRAGASTGLGVLINIAAGWALAMGHFRSAGLIMIVANVFDFIDGRVWLFILATLAVTLTVRLVLPVTAGMLTAVIILLPVAAAQGVHPWICVFSAAVFSDISFFRHQGTNGIIQMRSAGLFDDAACV